MSDQVIVALIGAVGIVVVALIGLVERRREKRRAQPARAVRDHVRIYDTLTELRHETDARRVAVVRTHNGGGIPSARVPLYSSALAEVTDGDAPPLRERWKALPVTETYARLLADMLTAAEVRVTPADLGDSRLAAIYEIGGTRSALKALLGTDPEALYYLSVQWPDDAHVVDAAARLAIDAAVRELRRALTLGTPDTPAD